MAPLQPQSHAAVFAQDREGDVFHNLVRHSELVDYRRALCKLRGWVANSSVMERRRFLS